MPSSSNNPALVAKALAKALSVESRLNALIGLPTTPIAPTVLYTGGGQVVVTQAANGNYTWTCPAGVTSAMVECWGAGAGGGGGTSGVGGEGGGGGAYGQEPAITVVPGTVYSYTVGNGGSGGPSSTAGQSGGDSFFNNGAGPGLSVYAHGGSAGSGGIGGAGGIGAANSISFTGGNGGGDGSQSTGGCGAGGSGGSTGNGGNGTDSGSGTGSAGGSAGAGGGFHGGAGGNSGANGVTGAGVGAGGGGSGSGTTTVINKTYNANTCRSYYGADAGSNANKTRQVNGTMWQGGESATGGAANGTQKFIFTFPTSPTIAADFSGATMTSAALTITNQHSWYNSGMSVQIRIWQTAGGLPATWNGLGAGLIFDSFIDEGETHTYSLGQTIAAGFASSTDYGIAFGPGPNAMDVNWYGYFYGAGSAHPPKLQLIGTVGTAINGGAGIDGQVQITYNLPATSTLVAAVQSTAISDAAGNQLAAGFTGSATAIQPGSSPANLETWHLASLGSGFTNQSPDIRCAYRITPDNMVQIVGTINASGATWASTALFTLPVGYRPSASAFIPCAIFPVAGGSAYLTITTAGVVNVSCVSTSTALIINGEFPLGIT